MNIILKTKEDNTKSLTLGVIPIDIISRITLDNNSIILSYKRSEISEKGESFYLRCGIMSRDNNGEYIFQNNINNTVKLFEELSEIFISYLVNKNNPDNMTSIVNITTDNLGDYSLIWEATSENLRP